MSCEKRIYPDFSPLPFRVLKGDFTDNVNLKVQNPDQATGLVNASIVLTIYEKHSGSTILERSTANGGIDITNGVDGIFDILPIPTADLPAKEMMHKLTITYADGFVKTIARDEFIVFK